ncbi:MAG: NapC/NirT family cytochrome c [Halioglobus sp.]|nr:NapC/NirT family cytochrome c [Halioglobus sp.]
MPETTRVGGPGLRRLAVGRVLAALLLVAAVGPAVATEAAACISCHDFGPDSPVHSVQAGSHSSSEEPGGIAGCPACHGASAPHTRAPTRVAPDVSFGPLWTSTANDQDASCLACHESGQAGAAAHWRDALHMLNNLTCVTCHDIHAGHDKVLFHEEQAQVCTICHKTQKQGIHGLVDDAEFNPPCSSCHNPHRQQPIAAEMLENDSAGCRSCHNLERIDHNPATSDKAKRYHRKMLKPGRTCLDCHEGIAHAPTGPDTAMIPEAVSTRAVTLFYPGMADSDWLLQAHPGSQPLRQGRACQQCHRGEEASMGAAQASGFAPAARDMTVSFAATAEHLTLTLRWQGPPDDADVALMWGDGGSDAFRRGGCFAACHSDLPGMSGDRGQNTGKYLWDSRAQLQRVGQPSMTKSAAELEALQAEGNFVEMWRVRLASGQVEVAALLADVSWQPSNLIQINKNYMDGWWTVALVTPLNNTASLKPFAPDGKYTFGVALHGAANPGGKHWVSLPMTLSFTGDETDFKVEQK